MKSVWLSWSSGKDSAWMLHKLRLDPVFRVTALFTTINEAFDRVAMHSVRRELVEMQARSVGLPLHLIPIPWPCSNQQYEEILGRFSRRAKAEKIDCFAFGDLFLEDVREYRIRQLQGSGIEAMFPLWKSPTRPLAEAMLSSGLQARVTCVDPKRLDRSFAGRVYDDSFLAELPASVDPCGENGEFHSFAFDGPMFQFPVTVETGEIVEREGFIFADLLPAVPG